MKQLHWQPSADINTLKRRAQLLADVRRFFARRQVLEVETPILSHAAPSAPYLDSFSTDYQPAASAEETCYLHTSPEFAMKRLLAAGSGDIYQIARVFRNGEKGRLHSPEFTMLEWYRPQLDYHALMSEVDDLLQQVAATAPAQKISYSELFKHYLHCEVHQLQEQQLKQLAFESIPSLPADWQTDHDGWLELLMSEVIEPQLAKLQHPVIVYDFPASQAQLAKLHRADNGEQVAARFELYAGGVELANGYDECLDAAELKQRFELDNQKRALQGKAVVPVDQHLLAALQAGLPVCTGVALGLDRLMLLLTGANQLAEVLSFDFERC